MGPSSDRTDVLTGRRDTSDLSCSEGHVRTQQEGSCLQTRKRDPARNQLCWHLDLELLASRTVENKFLLFKPPSLWYFVTAALEV